MSVIPLSIVLNQLWSCITTQAAGGAADPNLLLNVNDLIQRLYNDEGIDFVGKFADQLNLPVYTDANKQQTIALPPQFITAEYIHDNLGDIPIRSAFARYEDDRNQWSDLRHADDLGDTFCTYFDLPSPGKLFLKCPINPTPAAQTMFVQGLDQNGNPVSESMALNSAGVTSANTYSAITGLTKSAGINTTAALYWINGGTNTLIGLYQGNDLNPRVRRYYICPNTNDSAILAIKVRARFIPVSAGTDLITPGMIGALKNGLLSLAFENAGDENRKQFHWGEMLRILNGELAQYLGSAQLGTFQLDSGTSLGATRNIA